ncbi:Toprim-like [Desulfotomaculum arcticum]|uniref:Toprim-like n=1 Tax=Desulfotruncus arcticus DSM 17038 TaxID=1121424 RepID=A0A1I2YCJ8_9FIRM|nr:toprim domain-containing protein [Desulfotruncus arcticus]SFH22706.1 Toprim-like [Desulfotomaculum arcticum] [Desulfotruncus arcticus DSM 17038]
MRIKGYTTPVDVAAELNKYDWRRPRWTERKFQACSPFRDEWHPSFAVHLETGVFIDSGSISDEWRQGNFVKLLAYLRNETYEETQDYLLETYCPTLGNLDRLKLTYDLTLAEEANKPLDMAVLDEFNYRHPYLDKQRGIEEKWQRAFRVGYDRKHKAVTFPWYDRMGQLINIKFRSVTDKRFWYYADGQPIKNHVYALNFIYKAGKNLAYIVESEIDAITLWQAGFPAVALGGANLTPRKRELLLQSPIETFILATDNDKAGRRIAQTIATELVGFKTVLAVALPTSVKDVNDLTSNELLTVAAAIQPVIPHFN